MPTEQDGRGGNQCDRCEERPADPELTPNTDYDLCGQCKHEIMRESAAEGERGRGQLTAAEEHKRKRDKTGGI